jgi:hypothetical protein
MPLVTTDIFQARAAINLLELRTQSAEAAVVSLQSTVDTLTAVHDTVLQNATVQNDFTVSQIPLNAQLTTDQAVAVSPDLTLDNFIAALGLSLALAEATMPDRAISSASATVQSFLTFNAGSDGTMVPGLRLYQPELGASTALATTSFDLTKTLSGTTVAPRSLYSVLQDKQALYSGSYWTALTTGTPVVAPAVQIVAEIGKIFAAIGSWSFPYLLQEAVTIAGFETALVGVTSSSVAAGAAGAASAYAAGVASLTALNTALSARTLYVAGDLFALTSALDATTSLATSVHS